MRWKAAVVALAVIAPSLRAQVVRGVVTERVSGARVPGVVVSVASVGDSLTRHALTNARGEYAVTLPGAGAYSLSAKRIGVARYESLSGPSRAVSLRAREMERASGGR